MEKINLKKITKETRIYIKRQTIQLRRQGKKNQEISDILNIGVQAVANIISDYNHKGDTIFNEQVRGRKIGEKRTLSPDQEKNIQELMNTHTPEEEGIACSMWAKPAIRQLIQPKFNIDISLSSLTNYLKRWKMSCKRPTRKNYKQDDKPVVPTVKADIISKDEYRFYISQNGV